VLFVHEVHQVRGREEERFEEAYRDEWMPMLAKDDDARLLWFCRHVHGTAEAYNLLTVTAVRDGAAWQRLAERVQTGDLRAWMAKVDEMRHAVTTKTLLPVPWSPLQEVDFSTVPTTAEENELSLYMEDTGWPHAPVDDYIEFWGEGYYKPMEARDPATKLLQVEVSWQPAYGGGRRKEAILWQKIVNKDRLIELLVAETPPERKLPGTFMHEALNFRDQWQSRLLRTVSWSPRH
jgi:hypothetical protein